MPVAGLCSVVLHCVPDLVFLTHSPYNPCRSAVKKPSLTGTSALNLTLQALILLLGYNINTVKRSEMSKTEPATKAAAPVITVTIRWFSVLAEHRGCRREELTLESGVTGSELLERLAGETQAVSDYRQYIRLAVNQHYADESARLQDGDEVALITPVSGG